MIENRQMRVEELPEVLNWAAEEGWNPGLDDPGTFWAADPSGFFVASDNDGPVAAISVVNHSDAMAFLGLYLVRPDYRGRGIGFSLWQHALAHAGDRAVALDGVPAQQANYQRSGFVLTGQTHRYAGRFSAAKHPSVRPFVPSDLPQLAKLDKLAQGYSRDAFLQAWWTTPSANRRSLVDADGERVQGVVTFRRCREGTKIGPLLAPDMKSAGALLRAAAGQAEAPFIIDVPGHQTELAAWCEANSLKVSFETARMVRGTPPSFDDSIIQSVATLELG